MWNSAKKGQILKNLSRDQGPRTRTLLILTPDWLYKEMNLNINIYTHKSQFEGLRVQLASIPVSIVSDASTPSNGGKKELT